MCYLWLVAAHADEQIVDMRWQKSPVSRLFAQSFIQAQETSKLRVTGLCVGKSPVTDEFPAQRANNAEMFPFDDVIMY